jgi:hypothetical protein
MIRTSFFFSTALHDCLREIAYQERRSIASLIHEGLDHILSIRGKPSTEQLRKGIKA